MADVKKVMVSSTARDLPDHRKEVMDACLRQGMFPTMMEHLPASDADALNVSLEMVDEADLYLGILAHRYGHVPAGHNISITEMEYNRAVERGIPCLVFMMHEDHPVRARDVEKGEGAAKLQAFKARVRAERVVNFFQSPADLRAHVINSLSKYRDKDLTTLHYASDIPTPPELYIAHPYTLLQTGKLIGRQAELDLLTEWVANPRTEVYRNRILNIVAVGGTGKSALTWQWFNDIAPRHMQPLAGRMWWSFYESDARYENFVVRALAYTSRRPETGIREMSSSRREGALLRILDQEPFLLVLDGLERILIAYARMDAARLADDDLDQQTANLLSGARGLPDSAVQSFVSKHRLRKATNPRAGAFLRRLAGVRSSRVLVSTRLYPASLQTSTGAAIPGSAAHFLTDLSDEDALALWHAFGVGGSHETLLSLFRSFDNHPLLIQALASEVANYRRAPGNVDQWWEDHPGFDPFRLPLVQRKSHVLDYALRGLDQAAHQMLYTVAAFRMPATYDTLAALAVGQGRLFSGENELDVALTELEDRGLLGWDKRANRYDLHPIVRGVVWSELGKDTQQDVYTRLHAHFESLPAIDEELVNSVEDLTPAVELYNALIGLERYEDAYILFRDRLRNAMLYQLGASRQCIELLEMLFPDGMDRLPRLRDTRARSFALNVLALAYELSGQPGRAVPLYHRSNDLDGRGGDIKGIGVGLCNLAGALLLSAELYKSEAAARLALLNTRERNDLDWEAVSLQNLGLSLAVRGLADEARVSLQRALQIDTAIADPEEQGISLAYLAQGMLWLGEYKAASESANRAWELAAQLGHNERHFVRAERLQGAAALGLGDLATADERLHHALTRARSVHFVEEELPALIGLAELLRRRNDLVAARELLEDVWEAAERGPYPLFHADAYNVQAQIERDAGNHAAALETAMKAYRLAWCDGPPFAYHWGLGAARAHMKSLEVAEPTDLPPWRAFEHDPMPDVEINPPDKHHVDSRSFRTTRRMR